jgi:hypothetical protein
MKSTLNAAALILVSLLASGCNNGRTDLPNATFRVIHAAPTTGPITFKRVRANVTPLEYKSSSIFSFDVDTYTFNIELAGIDGSVTQTITLAHTLEEGTEYTLVLREIGGVPDAKVIEAPARDATSAGTQIQFVHAATSIGAVDLFVEPEGFDLASATPWATLTYDDVSAPRVFSTASYEFVVTEAGNRSNVLLHSDPIVLGASQNVVLFLADGAGTSVAPITITVGDGSGQDIVDRDLSFGLRVLNGVSDRSAIDAGLDLALSPPLIPALPFATVSDETPIPGGDHTITITPAGNPGVIEVDQAFTALKGSLGTWLITGAPGSLSAALLSDNFRQLAGEAKLRIFNASPLNGTIQVYVVAPGTDVITTPATEVLGSGTASLNKRFAPGDYELTVRSATDLSVIYGPTALTIPAEGYYGILLSDPVSGSGIDVQLLYDFN